MDILSIVLVLLGINIAICALTIAVNRVANILRDNIWK